MWIVLFALKYRYTVAVMAILILLFGVLSATKMSTDILPRVESPEITLVWTYTGLNAREMAAKITSFSEIATLNNVDDLVEARSETSNGIGLVKLRFQSYADPERALAQVTAVSQTILRRMPQGTTPPLIVRTSPSSVPILQLVISSDVMTDGELFDWARLTLRAQLQSIPGLRLTLPYGGASRQVMIDLNPEALNTFGLSAADVNRAISTQNLTLPAGTLRDGLREMPVTVNASPETAEAFLSLPIRSTNGQVVLLRDVANVRDGEAISTNVARLNGQNAVMVSILKLGNASTLDIVSDVLKRLPEIRASAPEGLRIEPIFDQSIFVQAAVSTVIKEIILVGSLVGVIVLLFLGSWRSTLIVLTSIPLALLCSIIGLQLAGATFNLMTLGGLSLAIGILVDNALVEIENVKRQIALGKDVRQAIVDGAQQVAFPEFVSTTCICIVFLPIFMLTGTSKFVFTPLALAVIFAMIASYLLSRTLVPTLASLMLPGEVEAEKKAEGRRPGPLRRMHGWIELGVDSLAGSQRRILGTTLRRTWIVVVLVAGIVATGAWAGFSLGREFFPTTDAGLMRLFLRVPTGTRVEETSRKFADIHREIRAIVPSDELLFVVENIGTPSAINQAWIESSAVGPSDGEILVQLSKEHKPTAGYMKQIRVMLAEKFPEVQAFFRPADATSQTLSSGAPTTFEVRLIGRDASGNLALANRLVSELRAIPGATDLVLREILDLPEYAVTIDRVRAAQLGITTQDATSALLAVLGSGGTVATNVWSDPKTATSYDVQLIAPPSVLQSVDQLLNLPIRPASGGTPVLLGAFATVSERRTAASVSRTTLQPTLTVLANVQGRDMGAVTRDLERSIASIRKEMKPGNRIELTGQAALMQSAYKELFSGLALAAVLIFLVMVVNFQSWTMPFIAISGLPLAVAGAFFGLFVTGTPLSVPALMGLIMVVGVSTANSVLVTSFARDLWVDSLPAWKCALEAATTRLRPVMMTAIAMVLGVVPMALGLGEGGEQNAPLGRAVIGGLVLGTLASLFVVPTVFAWALRNRKPPEAPKSEETSEYEYAESIR